jgi:alkyldihydroxyacetonephosphate synthase
MGVDDDPGERPSALLDAFSRALPDLVRSASSPDRIAYARDLWPRHHLEVSAGRIAEHRPALVVWPRDPAEVASVVRFCAGEGVPIVPFGAGSGVCGGVLPDARTVVLDLKRLSRWRKLDPEAPSIEVEAGALGIRLEEDLQARGFTTGHFPSSILCSTAGGWVAARGAGQC